MEFKTSLNSDGKTLSTSETACCIAYSASAARCTARFTADQRTGQTATHVSGSGAPARVSKVRSRKTQETSLAALVLAKAFFYLLYMWRLAQTRAWPSVSG